MKQSYYASSWIFTQAKQFTIGSHQASNLYIYILLAKSCMLVHYIKASKVTEGKLWLLKVCNS